MGGERFYSFMFANSVEIQGRKEGRGCRSETAVFSAWMIYDKVLFLGSLIIWHSSQSFSFLMFNFLFLTLFNFLFLTLSYKALLLPLVWCVNEWMYGCFDFGLIIAFVSAFFLSWLFMEQGTAQWLWSHLPAGHIFANNVGIKNCFCVPFSQNKLRLSPGTMLCFLLLPVG